MNRLQNIPGKVRNALYWTGYGLGTLNGCALAAEGAIAAADPAWTPPVAVLAVQAVVVLLSTQLNLLSASNVPEE